MPVRLAASPAKANRASTISRSTGVPDEIHIRVQTGPAINGTDLRDAPGDIKFGQFKNQIEYQDAGSGINRAMKKAVLDPIDTANLSGKTIDLVGVFRLINPKNWVITPVKVDGQMSDVPAEAPDAGEVVLAARNVAKTYGSIQALKGVNFDIHRGQVTALFGENGAGKSTLMKILSGVVPQTSGDIILDGRPVDFLIDDRSPRSRHLDHSPGTEPRAQSERARQHFHGSRDPSLRPASTLARRSGRRGPS